MSASGFDLVVLGAGSGGIGTALRAARHGASVALLDPGLIGGTCVNVGCVPKKSMWLAARMAVWQRIARNAGFATIPGALDWPAFVARRQAYIDRIHASYRAQFAQAGVELIAQSGRFTEALRIATPTRELRAGRVVIATGSRPRAADVRGAGYAMDSDGFFALKAAPQRVAIIGGGYVAAELAGILHALGSEVEIFVRASRMLDSFDSETVDAFVALMRARGIDGHFERTIASITRSDRSGLVLGFEHGVAAAAGFDAVIWAAGRQPNTETLDLARAGVLCTGTGHVQVDDWQDTNVSGVHAVGDVTGRVPLTPVAVAAGRRLADRLFGGDAHARVDYANVPTVLFGAVPLAAVGLTEAQARERHGGDTHVHRSAFRPMLNALVDCSEQVFMKLVCVGSDERIVGIHAVGDGVDEILQGFAVALRLGARKADFEATVAIHPTAAEELVLMR